MTDKKAWYSCYFILKGHIRIVGISEDCVYKMTTKGFWVTSIGSLARTFSDQKYWIPPSKIEFIEKGG